MNHQNKIRRATQRANRLAQRGMTLLEIMIVIAILGLLATVVVKNLSGVFDNAKIDTTQVKISEIEKIVGMYKIHFNEYPDSMKNLTNPKGRKPYIKKAPKDDWGNELIYKRGSGDTPFMVYSAGPDGVKGNDDDVYSKENTKQ